MSKQVKYSSMPTSAAAAAAATAVPVGSSEKDQMDGLKLGSKGEGHEIGDVEYDFDENHDENSCSSPTQESQQQWTKGEVQTPGFRDVYFAIAFILHLITVIVVAAALGHKGLEALSNVDSDDSNMSRKIGVASYRKLDDYWSSSTDDYASAYNPPSDDWSSSSSNYNGNDSSDTSPPPTPFFPLVILTSVISTPILFMLALWLLENHAAFLIKLTLWFSIGINALFAFIGLAADALSAFIVHLIFAALLAWYAKVVWHRIPYAAANLRSAVTAIKANLGIVLLSVTSVPVSLAWFTCWLFALLGTMQTDFMKTQIEEEDVSYQKDDDVYGSSSGSSEELSPLGTFVIFLFLLSFYWTQQVIKNIVLTTTAGVIGTWWFTPIEASSFCSKAVTDSFVRSSTYSLGSICFGSLIVAILEVLKSWVRSARNNRNGGLMVACAHCLLIWIERIAEYFNKWAFIYVGLYGYSYIEAAKKVMSLFRDRGWTVLINDTLVYRLLNIMSLTIGLLVGLIALIVGVIMDPDGEWPVLAMIIGLVIGLVLSIMMMSIVSSSVDTIIVCYAEAPDEFKENHPELHSEMETSWNQAWPNLHFTGVVVIPMGGLT